MQDPELREIGRRIGYDLFRARRLADEARLPPAIGEGIADARSRGIAQVSCDRFAGKCLQLRLNAYRRGRVVDERVTPGFLREIDVATCPVTRETLTHRAMLGTDWSVDRLNNDGAYAPSNLAVMSTVANRAKGSRGFDEVHALACGDRPVDGLTPGQWMRLAALMLGPCFAEDSHRAPVIPLVAPIPARTVRPAVQLVQYAFTCFAASPGDRNRLVRRFRPVSRSAAPTFRLERFADALHVALRHTTPCWDAWLVPGVMDAFVAWRTALDARGWMLAGEIARDLAGGHRVERDLRAWHLDTRGYHH